MTNTSMSLVIVQKKYSKHFFMPALSSIKTLAIVAQGSLFFEFPSYLIKFTLKYITWVNRNCKQNKVNFFSIKFWKINAI